MLNEFEPTLIEEEQPQKPKNKRIMIAVICVLLVVILALTTALLLKKYVLSTFIVDGISMYPTLDGGAGDQREGDSQEERTNGEKLFLNKAADISRGDIIVFTPDWIKNSDGEYISLVKRVIGIGGDHIVIKGDQVWLNGELLDEPYINDETVAFPEEYDVDLYVPYGELFCMGDNRNHSDDSRIYGTVSLDDVVGKCFLIRGLDGELRKP